jgi:glycerol transport system ATP-binding protein
VMKKGEEITLENNVMWRSPRIAQSVPDGNYTIGIRPHHITPVSQAKEASVIEGRVLVTELSGSESVIHFDMNGQTWVSQSHGIHPFEVGATARLFVDVEQSFFFNGDNRLVGGAA